MIYQVLPKIVAFHMYGQDYTDHCWAIGIKHLHNPLVVCIRKNICILEQGACHGWDGTASVSVIKPVLH
jgi:hypothetical protein